MSKAGFMAIESH